MLTTQQAAARRGVRPVTVRKWVLHELLPATKIGSDWLIEEAALDAFVPRPNGRPRKPNYKHPAARPPRAACVARVNGAPSEGSTRPTHHGSEELLP